MMKIKFRAWHKSDKKMYEVYGLSNNQWFLRGKRFPMQPGAINVMQLTRLKDENGKGIFISDIVEYTKIIYTDCSRTEIDNIQEPIIGEIYLAEGLWIGIKDKSGTGRLFLPGTISTEENNLELKVIGNIYENPELLN